MCQSYIEGATTLSYNWLKIVFFLYRLHHQFERAFNVEYFNGAIYYRKKGIVLSIEKKNSS